MHLGPLLLTPHPASTRPNLAAARSHQLSAVNPTHLHHLLRASSRPPRVSRAAAPAPARAPATAKGPHHAGTSFAQAPNLTITVSPQATAPTETRFAQRAFAASRRGYDHSWIGVLTLTALLLVTGVGRASAAEPMSSPTGTGNWSVHEEDPTAGFGACNATTRVALGEIYEIE
jgi:hypothetical protein